MVHPMFASSQDARTRLDGRPPNGNAQITDSPTRPRLSERPYFALPAHRSAQNLSLGPRFMRSTPARTPAMCKQSATSMAGELGLGPGAALGARLLGKPEFGADFARPKVRSEGPSDRTWRGTSAAPVSARRRVLGVPDRSAGQARGPQHRPHQPHMAPRNARRGQVTDGRARLVPPPSSEHWRRLGDANFRRALTQNLGSPPGDLPMDLRTCVYRPAQS